MSAQSLFKYNFAFVFIVLFSLWLFQIHALNGPTNQDVPATGAPGENTCSTEPGCHASGNFTGTIELAGLPDTVEYGETYLLTYTFQSPCTRTGFEITCLDTEDMPCGTIIAGAGSSIMDNNLFHRTYLRQSTPQYLVDAEASWFFAWTAPNHTTQTSATFYMAGLASDGNNEKYGDNAITATRTVHFPSTTSAAISPDTKQFASVSPNPSAGMLYVQADKHCTLRIFSLNGILVRVMDVDSGGELDLHALEEGVYYFEFVRDGKSMIQRVSLVE